MRLSVKTIKKSTRIKRSRNSFITPIRKMAGRVSVRLQNGLGFFRRSSARQFLNSPRGVACLERRNAGVTMFHSNSDE